MLSITLKIAVDAPIPSASVSIAIAANPGVFPRFLSAYRISCPSVSIFTPTSISTQFDQPPLQPTPTLLNPYSAALFPANPVEAGATCPAYPEHLGDQVGSPGSFPSVVVAGLQTRPFFSLELTTPPSKSSTKEKKKCRQNIRWPWNLQFEEADFSTPCFWLPMMRYQE